MFRRMEATDVSASPACSAIYCIYSRTLNKEVRYYFNVILIKN